MPIIEFDEFCLILYLMIERLPKYDDELAYRNEPLLEYVVKVANHFWPSYDTDAIMKVDGIERNGIVRLDSTVPEIFADRFHNGKIHILDNNEYLRLVELQDTLRAFNLNPSKFWYLGLCIRDVVIGQTRDVYSFYPSHRKQIEALLTEIEKLIPERYKNKERSYCPFDGDAELTFKVKGSKHPIKITDNGTIGVLYHVLRDFLSKGSISDSEILDSASVNLSETKSLAQIKQVYLFNYYLSWFLNDFTADKTIKASKDGWQISYDKRFLVSRMVYATGLVRNRKYYDNQDFLKNNLKSYKDIDYSTLNNYY